MSLSRNDQRRVKLAAKAAANSDCKYTLGAVLVNSGRIMAQASNRQRNAALSAAHENCTEHAEEAVLRIAGEHANGATLYVARIGKSGQHLPAKPCLRCHQQLVAAGVTRVVYTDTDGLGNFRPQKGNEPAPRKRYEHALVTS